MTTAQRAIGLALTILVASGAAAAPAPRRLTFAVQVDDAWDGDESARAVSRLLDLFAGRGMPAELWLTAPVVAALERADPALLGRLRAAAVTIGYLVAPPHPLCAGFDDRLGSLDPDRLVSILDDYEHHALDLRTGDLDATRPGGYAWVAERLGRKPSVVVIPNEDPAVKAAAVRVYARLGAERLVLYRETEPAAGGPDTWEWRESVLLQPTGCLRPSIATDSLFWPHVRALPGDPLSLGSRLDAALASFSSPDPVPVTAIVHESAFYRKGADPVSTLYYAGANPGRPLKAPYATTPPRAPRRAGAMQTLLWNAYRDLLTRAAGKTAVVDTQALLPENARCHGPRLPDDVEKRTNLEYARRGRRPMLLDLLIRPGSEPRPAVLFLHGGAWRFGSKGDWPPLAARLLESGIAVASADYRPSTEAPFPAQLDDVRDALLFLRDHAAENGLDGRRLALWGESSGGHLAALVATNRSSTAPRVAGVVDCSGPADLASLAEGPLGSAVQLLLAGGVRAADASPLAHVSAEAPPFLLVHGDRDQMVPIDQSRRLNAALVGAGVASTLLVMPGARHGEYDDAAEDAITRFLERALAEPRR